MGSKVFGTLLKGKNTVVSCQFLRGSGREVFFGSTDKFSSFHSLKNTHFIPLLKKVLQGAEVDLCQGLSLPKNANSIFLRHVHITNVGTGTIKPSLLSRFLNVMPTS